MQTLKGFRDFLPAEKSVRDQVKAKIEASFQRFGFAAIETPTLEYASLLLGKYGKEADKLVYSFKDRGEREVALRYDQTVPTARVLAQYQNALPKIFKRYQIQNVFRADKPQQGRFREFTQCDIDIYGSTSPIADAEILAATYAVFIDLGFKNIILKINDRQTLLATLSPFATPEVDVFSIIQSIDKLDKVSVSEVANELIAKGLKLAIAERILSELKKADLSNNLQEIVAMATALGVPKSVLKFDPNLARGLDYYTGLIFEVILPEYGVGSVGGGGRYDQLIEKLSGLKMPAVGIGLGFDRIVEAAVQLGLVSSQTQNTQVLVTVFDDQTLPYALEIAQKLRQAKINTQLYPALDKLSKQFKYADTQNISWVIIAGEEEMKAQQVTLKNMKTGEQSLLSWDEAIKIIKK